MDSLSEPSRRAVGLALALLVLLGAALRVGAVPEVTGRTPDERTYTYYARHIVEGGLRAFPELAADHHQDSRLWIYPPPTRVGEVLLVAAAMKLSGSEDERAGSWVSCLASVAALALLAGMALRFLPAWAALYAAGGLAVSLPSLIVAFRAWPDAPMELAGVLMVWAACELRRGPRRWWRYAILVGAGSASVLFKETGAAVYLGCVVYVTLILVRERVWRELVGFFACGLAAAALSAGMLAAAAGGIGSLVEVWRHTSQGLSVNAYGLEFQSGPWPRFFEAFWILTPVTLPLAVIGVGVGLKSRLPAELRSLVRLFSWIALLLLLAALVVPISQNFRYLSPMYGCLYLLGGMGLWAIVERFGRRRLVLALAAAAVLAIGWRDYQILRRATIGVELKDLSVKAVLDSAKD